MTRRTLQDWGSIFFVSLLTMIFLLGFLILGFYVRYAWKTFNCRKHVFLLLLLDLITSILFLVAAIIPAILQRVMADIQIACLLEVSSHLATGVVSETI